MGAYAVKPEWGSRSISVASALSGTSMMRWPSGSVSLPSSFRNSPPAIRVFGASFVSTTLIHGVHFIDPKYSAVALISSSVIAFAMAIIVFVFAFRGSALLREPFLKSFICWMK